MNYTLLSKFNLKKTHVKLNGAFYYIFSHVEL